jgi:hypothetical protein
MVAMERARKIVEEAASLGTSASEWLRLDEHGVHEMNAAGYLASTADKVKQLGLSEEQADHEIAVKLALDAVDAMIRTTVSNGFVCHQKTLCS